MSDFQFPEPYQSIPLTTDPVIVKDESADLKQYPEKFVAGSEELDESEIRVTALGTGYPARRGQGCAGFMVELGNDEVFIFDAGAGTNLAFNHMRVPYHKANKFFITHYHIDHIADLQKAVRPEIDRLILAQDFQYGGPCTVLLSQLAKRHCGKRFVGYPVAARRHIGRFHGRSWQSRCKRSWLFR